MTNFIFSLHAAKRWFERFGNLDVNAELESAKRSKMHERQYVKRKNRKLYITKSGAGLLCNNCNGHKEVITVLPFVNSSGPYNGY